MAGRSDYSQSWMKMSTSYYQDPKVMDISINAECLFVRMLALAKQTGSGGIIDARQLPLISRGMRTPHKHAAELERVGLISDSRRTHERVSSDSTTTQQPLSKDSGSTHERVSNDSGSTQEWVINGYTKWYGEVTNDARGPDVSAGHDAASRARPRERPRAREREKEEREQDSVRSSGTERTESAARAAPLAGGAAARHAQIAAIRAPWDPPEPDTVDAERAAPSPENAKLIRAAIDKGYALPGSKGKPAKLWKYERTLNSYDPDGPPARIAPRIDKPADRPDAHPAHIRSVMQDTIDKLRARGYSDEDMGLRSDFDPGDPQ